MFYIDQPDPPQGFFDAWKTAGCHLNAQVQDELSWIRANMYKPLVEHLSFRIGNQIFWIFLELFDEEKCILPFTEQARIHFLEKAEEANVVPCTMRMTKTLGRWRTYDGRWGLRHALSKDLLQPLDLVTDELVEMSAWELQDMAVQVVRNHLEDEGKELGSWTSYLDIDPSIWFEDEDEKHWVVVRVAKYPEAIASMPGNIADIADSAKVLSSSGYFASVGLADMNDPLLPLYRGHGMNVRFEGLETLETGLLS